MLGTMMDCPLLISSILRHAAQNHAPATITSRTVEGPIHRYTYADANLRIQQLAHALIGLGVAPGDRIGTLAWNGYRHFELYYGVSGIGAVCHIINPRLFAEQIKYIINHAEDAWLFVDLTFVPLVEGLAPALPRLKGVVIMTDAAHMPATSLPHVLCYEDLIAGQPTAFDWPVFDERTPSSLCYTSGTTGNPKGVVYTHRSTLLHSMAILQADMIALRARDTLLPIVPLFHVNAWGLPYAAPMVGTSLVFPGPAHDGRSIYELIEGQQVTTAAGVPTVWFNLLSHVRESGARFSSLKLLMTGGSAMPRSVIETFEETYGVEVLHAWGMTELSPVGTTGRLIEPEAATDRDTRFQLKSTQGRPLFGVEMKIVDAGGKPLPHDGAAFGEVLVRGPWVTGSYYQDEAASRAAVDSDGWFRTGDVATLDARGWMRIVDRSKDVIKSGGEWISSIDVENAAIAHPGVAEAAVIAVPPPTWTERPLLVVVKRPDGDVTAQSMLAHLASRMPKWWLPDDVVFVDELPHTATGKLLKTRLREMYRDHRLPAKAAGGN